MSNSGILMSVAARLSVATPLCAAIWAAIFWAIA